MAFHLVSGELAMVRTVGNPPITNFTMLARVKLTADTDSERFFLRIGMTDMFDHYVVGVSNTGTTLFTHNGSSQVLGPELSIDRWYDIGMTVSGTGVGAFLIYVDGHLVVTHDGYTVPTNDEMQVGGWLAGRGIPGDMQDILVYERVLSPAEILRQTQQRVPFSTVGLNTWSPCRSLADNPLNYAGAHGLWTVDGVLEQVAGPAVPWELPRRRRSVVAPASPEPPAVSVAGDEGSVWYRALAG